MNRLPLRRTFALSAVFPVLLCAGCKKDEDFEIRKYSVPKTEAVYQANHVEGAKKPPSGDPHANLPQVASKKKKQSMLGAIVVESDRSMMFFKLTVPTAEVGKLPSKMAAMIDSMKIENGRPIWTLPEGWKRLPDDSPRNAGGGFPRVATILVDPENPKRELAVSRLGNPGTQDEFILQNVNRWRGQLGLGPVTLANLYNDEKNVDAEQQVIKRKLSNGMNAVFVNLTGFQGSGGMGRPPFLR